MDQRPRGDVLEAVPHAADEVRDDHEAEHEPERRDELAEPLDDDAYQRRGREPGQRHATRDDVRADEHAERPGAEHDADPDVLDAEDVLRVDEVSGDRRTHEEERDEDDDHHERDEAVAEEERDAVARTTALVVLARLGTAPHGERQPREADGDERDRVDGHRGRGPPGGNEQAAAHRADGEAERAGGLTVPFVCCRLREPETAGTSANSAACATAIPTPRSAASARSGATELTAASTTATPAWANGDEHEERARLDPVDEQSDVLGEDHDGRPQADE
jgi:hypothetical protein